MSVSDKQAVVAYLEQGLDHFGKGRSQEARLCWQKVLQLEPANHQANEYLLYLAPENNDPLSFQTPQQMPQQTPPPNSKEAPLAKSLLEHFGEQPLQQDPLYEAFIEDWDDFEEQQTYAPEKTEPHATHSQAEQQSTPQAEQEPTSQAKQQSVWYPAELMLPMEAQGNLQRQVQPEASIRSSPSVDYKSVKRASKETQFSPVVNQRVSTDDLIDPSFDQYTNFDKPPAHYSPSSNMRNEEPKKHVFQSTSFSKGSKKHAFQSTSFSEEPKEQDFQPASFHKEPKNQAFQSTSFSKEPKNQAFQPASFNKEPKKQAFQSTSFSKEPKKQAFQSTSFSKEPKNQAFQSTSFSKEPKSQAFQATSFSKEPKKQAFQSTSFSKEDLMGLPISNNDVYTQQKTEISKSPPISPSENYNRKAQTPPGTPQFRPTMSPPGFKAQRPNKSQYKPLSYRGKPTPPPLSQQPQSSILATPGSPASQPVNQTYQKPTPLPLGFSFQGAKTVPAEVPTPQEPVFEDENELLISGAKDLIRDKDFQGANELLELALQSIPSHKKARQLQKVCRGELTQVYLGLFQSLNIRPRLLSSPTGIKDVKMDHRRGFILSQLDGSTSIEEILLITGFGKFEVLHFLYDLIQKKHLSF